MPAPDEYRNGRCHARRYRLAGDVLYFTVEGYLDLEAARHIMKWTDEAVADRPQHIFHDWEELQGYDSESREELTEYVSRLGLRILSTLILVRSSIVAMGVT